MAWKLFPEFVLGGLEVSQTVSEILHDVVGVPVLNGGVVEVYDNRPQNHKLDAEKDEQAKVVQQEKDCIIKRLLCHLDHNIQTIVHLQLILKLYEYKYA